MQETYFHQICLNNLEHFRGTLLKNEKPPPVVLRVQWREDEGDGDLAKALTLPTPSTGMAHLRPRPWLGPCPLKTRHLPSP